MTFVGNVVSIDCGEVLGTYQGVVLTVDQSKNELTIGKPFRNGTQCVHQKVTICASDIKDLQILKTPEEAQFMPEVRHGPTSSPAAPRIPEGSAAPARASSAELRSDRQPSPFDNSSNSDLTSGHRSRSRGCRNEETQRSSPVKNIRSDKRGEWNRTPNEKRPQQFEQEERKGNGIIPTQLFQQDFANVKSGTGRRNGNNFSGSTPRKIEGRRGRPAREDCFSAPLDSYLYDFDFEKNLALFDKQAVFMEIECSNGSASPVRGLENRQPAKYKHDENVLDSGPVVLRQIQIKGFKAAQEYVTDSGLVVPCISHSLRSKLLATAETYGLTLNRQLEMVGRSASEMVMQLLGGSSRLNPQNSHQKPNVFILCGPHIQGAMGVNCARQLASHNVKVTVFVPNFKKVIEDLEIELNMFELTDGIRISRVEDLTCTGLDMIVNALDNHENRHLLSGQSWYKEMCEWANNSRANVLSIDPPVEGCTIDTKWSLALALPLTLSDRCGQVYLCDLNVPTKVFTQCGISYRSPFAHKFVIPLHSKT